MIKIKKNNLFIALISTFILAMLLVYAQTDFPDTDINSDPYKDPASLSASHASSATGYQIGIILNQRTDLIKHLSDNQLRPRISELTSSQISFVSPGAINGLTREDAEAYFNNKWTVDGYTLSNPNEWALMRKINGNLDSSLDSTTNVKVSNSGKQVSLGDESVDLTNSPEISVGMTNGKLSIDGNVLEQGSVLINSDGSLELLGSRGRTEVISTDGIRSIAESEDITLYLDESNPDCIKCISIDTANNKVRIDGDGISVQLAEDHKSWTLDAGNSIGVNYVLDKDGEPTLKIKDGKTGFVPGKDGTITGFSTIQEDGTVIQVAPDGNFLSFSCSDGDAITGNTILDITGYVGQQCILTGTLSGIIKGGSVDLKETDEEGYILVNGIQAKILKKDECAITCMQVEMPDGSRLYIYGLDNRVSDFEFNTQSGFIAFTPGTGIIDSKTTEDGTRVTLTTFGDGVFEFPDGKTIFHDAEDDIWYILQKRSDGGTDFIEVPQNNVDQDAIQFADELLSTLSLVVTTQNGDVPLTPGTLIDKVIITEEINERTSPEYGKKGSIVTRTVDGVKVFDDFETGETYIWDPDTRVWYRLQNGDYTFFQGGFGEYSSGAINSLGPPPTPKVGDKVSISNISPPDEDERYASFNGYIVKVVKVYSTPFIDVLMPDGKLVHVDSLSGEIKSVS